MQTALSYHEILYGRKAELERRILSRESVEIEPHAEPMDRTLALSEREQSARTIDACRIQLRQVDEAIRRLHDGGYAICDYCGREIPRERLMAVPWAMLCLQCQADVEAAEGNPLPEWTPEEDLPAA
jgi:DnaK suppressor protein